MDQRTQRRPSARRSSKPAPPAAVDRFFVQVAVDESAPQFFDITEHLGRSMPFRKPTATCAMRVTERAVSFSLLMVTKRTAQNLAERPLGMPEGPLAKLERKVRKLGMLPADKVVVEYEGETYTMELSRDSSGLVTVDDPAEDPLVFVLPNGGPKLAIYLLSPAVGRTLSVSAMGARYPGRPGQPESLARAVSMYLFQLSQLTEFRLLSGIETVDIPSPPSRQSLPVVDTPDELTLELPAYLFAGNPPAPVGAGPIGIAIDLKHVNPSTSKLLFRFTPAADLVDRFTPEVAAQLERALLHVLTVQLGVPALQDVTYDIVVDAVDASAAERLREALSLLSGGVDLAPGQWRAHDDAARARIT